MKAQVNSRVFRWKWKTLITRWNFVTSNEWVIRPVSNCFRKIKFQPINSRKISSDEQLQPQLRYYVIELAWDLFKSIFIFFKKLTIHLLNLKKKCHQTQNCKHNLHIMFLKKNKAILTRLNKFTIFDKFHPINLKKRCHQTPNC